MNSELVAQGTLYLNYNPERAYTLAGRKDITSVNSDSAYEKGIGIIQGGINNQNNKFDLDISICTNSSITQSLHIRGIWNDTLLIGERFTYLLGGPNTEINLGSYIATRVY